MIFLIQNILIVILVAMVVKLHNDLRQIRYENIFLSRGFNRHIRELVYGSKNNVKEDITNNISNLLITSNSDREKYISMIYKIKYKQKENIEKMLKEDNVVDDNEMIDIFARIMLKRDELMKEK